MQYRSAPCRSWGRSCRRRLRKRWRPIENTAALLQCPRDRWEHCVHMYVNAAVYGFIILHIVELFWVLLTIHTALCASCSWFFLSICELFLFTSTAWGRVKCCCQAWGAPSISACSSAARCCAWTPAALPHTSTLCCCLWSVPSTHGSLSYMSLFC